ncbi:MAG: hypothetical protein HC841_06395 [Verrucomicrobiae bacterium]|nr:hypothetical protein [Verrucomicrobiae bacterium]
MNPTLGGITTTVPPTASPLLLAGPTASGKSAVALAEPLLLFMIAGFIGVIFIGMALPIFSLQDHIK